MPDVVISTVQNVAFPTRFNQQLQHSAASNHLEQLPSYNRADNPAVSGSNAPLIRPTIVRTTALQAVTQDYAVVPRFGQVRIPDFANSGHLEVNKKKGVVTTPGGYKISMKNGELKILSPANASKKNSEEKWTTIKADWPDKIVEKSESQTQTRSNGRVIRSITTNPPPPPSRADDFGDSGGADDAGDDPVVRESDGNVWRYRGWGSFLLPDGTKITVQEKGKEENIHINQVDIYNGNKHVGIKNKLTKARWKKVDEQVSQKAGAWQTTNQRDRWVQSGNTRRLIRTTEQSRTVETHRKERHKIDQTFSSTVSDVKSDGYQHDKNTRDGKVFRLAGDGDDWKIVTKDQSTNGRELLSGAGVGKDDQHKMYQLGDKIADSDLRARGLHVPWKTKLQNYGTSLIPLGTQQIQMNSTHWQNLQTNFIGFQHQRHIPLPVMTPEQNPLRNTYAGPFGGMSLYPHQNISQQHPEQILSTLYASIGRLISLLSLFDEMKSGRQMSYQRALHG